jgi:F-type H+-transporting ATPase subunit b
MEMLHEPEVWVAVGFVLVVALLLAKGVPGMIGTMLDRRSALIAAELEEARKLRAEAAAVLADYRARAESAERDAAAIVESAKAEAAQFAADSRAALSQQIARRADAARDKIAQAEAAALTEIRAMAADAAVAGARTMIAARLDEARAAGLIDSAIKDLGGKLN